MNRRLYAYANVGRHGLGNMLFPWARAEVFCHATGAAMLSVPWVQVRRIGPWLRGERDKRYYIGLFTNNANIRGPHKWLVQAFSRKVPESQLPSLLEPPADGDARTVVVFHGMEGLFAPLLGHRDFIRERLHSILTSSVCSRLQRPAERYVAIHVRRGDFTKVAPGEAIPKGAWNYQLPDEWYLEALRGVREAIGWAIPAVVFSDASQEELTAFTATEDVSLAKPNPSIVAIMLLSQGAALIASGSSFSMWASFLGAMPTLWYPGQHRQTLIPQHAGYECEFDATSGKLPGAFAKACREQVDKKA